MTFTFNSKCTANQPFRKAVTVTFEPSVTEQSKKLTTSPLPNQVPDSEVILPKYPQSTHCACCDFCRIISYKKASSEQKINPHPSTKRTRESPSPNRITDNKLVYPSTVVVTGDSQKSRRYVSADTLAVDTKYYQNEFKQHNNHMHTKRKNCSNSSRKSPFY